MFALTRRQAEVLAFIRSYAAEHGMPPTRAEIAAEFGFASPNAAQSHLRALERRGALDLTGGTSRGIRLLGTGHDEVDTLPLVGRVAAGQPLLAVVNVESRHRVAPNLFSPRADYLLRVQGDSMIDAGIRNADLLAVHATPDARSGQIVVARLDEDVTVKRLKRSDGRITLESANAAYGPIVVDAKRQAFAVEGVAVGVIRQQGF